MDVCIIGAGPGGAMLAMLLARLGISVALLEKSRSNKREFRGESISPDSVAILDTLKIMPALERHGYLETKRMEVCEAGQCLLNVDFSRFPYPRPFSIDIPQRILIGAFLEEACLHPNFLDWRGKAAESLIIEEGEVRGVVSEEKGMPVHIKTKLVVAADGRYGKVRKWANLGAKITPLSRDILWFLLKKPPDWGDIVKISLCKDQHLIALPTHPNTLRVGLNIPHGEYKKIRSHDIAHLHALVAQLEPTLAETVKCDVSTWSDTTLLDIFTAEVPVWARDGLILIGDAAHTLTPVLGQGVNHALKDAFFLAPLIKAWLDFGSENVMPACALQNFIRTRKRDVSFVHRFQVQQEKMLAKQSWFKTKMRRSFYRILNRYPILQDRLWGRMLYSYQEKK